MQRAAALVVLGLWLGMLFASWVIAAVNFRTVDRVLGPGQAPELATRMAPLAADDRRVVLRHLASEINRWMFRRWSLAQLVLGLAALALCWRSGGATRLLVAAAVLLVLAQLLAVGPIVTLGRAIDFVPRPLPPDVARRFGLLHAAYVGSDLLKGVLLAAAAWMLAVRQAGGPGEG
jgi:hypothetical protein